MFHILSLFYPRCPQLFSLQGGLQRCELDGSVSHTLTLLPPCSFALYSRSLQLPKLWSVWIETSINRYSVPSVDESYVIIFTFVHIFPLFFSHFQKGIFVKFRMYQIRTVLSKDKKKVMIY